MRKHLRGSGKVTNQSVASHCSSESAVPAPHKGTSTKKYQRTCSRNLLLEKPVDKQQETTSAPVFLSQREQSPGDTLGPPNRTRSSGNVRFSEGIEAWLIVQGLMSTALPTGAWPLKRDAGSGWPAATTSAQWWMCKCGTSGALLCQCLEAPWALVLLDRLIAARFAGELGSCNLDRF